MNGRKLDIVLLVFKLSFIKNFGILLQQLLINDTLYFFRQIFGTVGGDHLSTVQEHDVHPIRNIREVFPRMEIQKKVNLVFIFRKVFEKGYQDFFCAAMTQ